jgi:hypothetical protein
MKRVIVCSIAVSEGSIFLFPISRAARAIQGSKGELLAETWRGPNIHIDIGSNLKGSRWGARPGGPVGVSAQCNSVNSAQRAG